MKNLLKSKKGITLIALIITVIIMLILSGVAISVVVDSEGLFGKVRRAETEYENAAKNEADQIQSLIDEIDKYLVGTAINPDDSEQESSDIVYIYNKEDLEEFKNNVNNGNTYAGMTVELMDNIDLGGDPNNSETWWTPIGAVGSVFNNFSGIFDGNNYEIEGIYNNVESTSETKDMGFFAGIENATIKNLTLSGDIILGAHIEGDVGLAAGGFSCNVYADNLILNCINKINLTKVSTGRDVAGFVSGMAENSVLTIRNCINYGNITGSNNCGGFVGNVNYGKKLIIEDSCNKGEITNYLGNYAGGLIGRDAPLEGSSTMIIIDNSYNEGTIRARGDTGGLAGRINNNITINNSYNIGEIYHEQRNSTRCIGGLIGKVVQTSENCIIVNSYNVADIIIAEEEYNTNVGGLIGETRSINTDIINSYNLGNISNAFYGCGICGLAAASANTTPIFNINNCYNAGGISGDKTAGIAVIYNTPVTANIDNAYYLDTSSNIGVYHLATETDLENPIYDNATSLSETQMKAQTFVNDLNTNIQNIDTEYDLRSWKLVSASYPEFE